MLASPLGRYLPGTSLLHRLDPRVKLVSIIVCICATVSISNPIQLFWALGGLLVLCICSRLSPASIFSCIKPIAPFAAIVTLFNLFVVQGGAELYMLGALSISEAGLWAALLYTARLLMAVTLGALLLLTTTPTALTDAAEGMLAPLGRLGVPVHEIAMVFSLALRFVPILADETQSVIDAQAARGGSIEDGSPAERLRALTAVLSAVFAGALRHAQNLSRALDARCYEGGEGRTHYREMCFRHAEALFITVCLVWFALLIVLSW